MYVPYTYIYQRKDEIKILISDRIQNQECHWRSREKLCNKERIIAEKA